MEQVEVSICKQLAHKPDFVAAVRLQRKHTDAVKKSSTSTDSREVQSKCGSGARFDVCSTSDLALSITRCSAAGASGS
jgi:hypothetical protein